jgi:hypothetical protein
MKKNIVILGFITVLTFVAGIASASNGIQLNAAVPFAFYVENQLLPAGEYKFEMGAIGIGASASSVIVRAKDGTGIRILITMADTDENAFSNHLRFNRYGDKYFLSSVAIRSYKANLKSTKLEQELRSQIEKAESTTLVAQH